jgi:hypothetical protein
MGFVWIGITILLTAYGQIVLKWRMNLLGAMPAEPIQGFVFLLKALLDVYIISSFSAAFLASLTWMAAMTKFQLTFAYPFMAATFGVVLLAGWFFLGETMTWNKLACIGLIATALWVGSR